MVLTVDTELLWYLYYILYYQLGTTHKYPEAYYVRVGRGATFDYTLNMRADARHYESILARHDALEVERVPVGCPYHIWNDHLAQGFLGVQGPPHEGSKCGGDS